MESQERPLLEMTFRPTAVLVSLVREFVSDLYQHVVTDQDTAFRVALTTHELLENAAKYSLDGETEVRIGTAVHQGARMIEVRIANRTTDAHMATMTRALDELAAAEDPMIAYQRVMRRNARRQDGSGLGLARICAEGEMSLDYEIDGDRVCVLARTPLPAQGAR